MPFITTAIIVECLCFFTCLLTATEWVTLSNYPGHRECWLSNSGHSTKVVYFISRFQVAVLAAVPWCVIGPVRVINVGGVARC